MCEVDGPLLNLETIVPDKKCLHVGLLETVGHQTTLWNSHKNFALGNPILLVISWP